MMGAPYQQHSDTSKAAAERILPHMSKQRRRVYLYLELRGEDGATDEEVCDALKMSGSSVRPRRVELVRDGLVEDSGIRQVCESGREAVVWRITGQ